MRERLPQKTLGDYVTIALSPLLIMALVGSLVFFLLEVLYAGQYSSRLQWTMFWFVFAMVLIARIAIEQNDGKAGMYALALGAAVFVSLQMFIEYPPDAPLTSVRWLVNLVLMALIWWCAHRLVWDCTYIEDADKSSGSGILDAAGLDAAQGSTEEAEEEDTDEDDDKKSAKRSKKQLTGVSGWLDRHRLYRERQEKKPHTPGVWIVYFSLAALPLFGLGQSLIPAAALDRRRYAFWLMVIYVGSGLGLLLTTSYLGLRRYLRQRKLKMPVSTTAVWLTLGGGLIVAMLLVGAILPRPYGEYQLIKIKPLGSPNREASKHAVLRDGAGKGQGSASKDPKATDAKAKDGSGNQRSDKGGGSAKGDKGSGSGKGNKSSSSSKGEKSGGKSGNGKSSDDQSRDDSRKSPEDKADKSDRSDDRDKDKNGDQKQQDKQSGSGRSQDQQDKQNNDDPENKDESGGSDQQESSPSSYQFMEKLGWLGTLLKWIVFAIIALVAIFFLLRSGLRWLANFTLWARNLLNALSAWWQSLFGGGSGAGAAGGEEDETEPVRRPRPFALFSNPFRDGTATQVSPEEVARYTFAALEAWAYDHDLAREQEETPLEFYERVAKLTPSLAADGKRMVGCYVRVAYARSRLAPAALEALEKFWISLESADGPDMAAKAAWEEENGA
jgi:hypothetical protein